MHYVLRQVKCNSNRAQTLCRFLKRFLNKDELDWIIVVLYKTANK